MAEARARPGRQGRGLRAAEADAHFRPILGRENEIAAVVTLLRDPDVHLVTLIGPGGIGKTRLAIEVARKISTAEPRELRRSARRGTH
jgi:ATP-dependent Clp protease ATP-binding subunit ClpA